MVCMYGVHGHDGKKQKNTNFLLFYSHFPSKLILKLILLKISNLFWPDYALVGSLNKIYESL